MSKKYKFISESNSFFTKGSFYERADFGMSFVASDTGDSHGFNITFLEENFRLLDEVTGGIVEAPTELDDIEKPKKAFDRQEGGNHYSKLKIQPMRYALENDLNYGQSNAVKYITRYKDKNGIADLKKAIHCIELLIEFEEG